MDSTQDSRERRTPNLAPPRGPPTQDEQETSSLDEARPERPAKFTEHLDDDNPAHAFEYSETWKLLQESETMLGTPEAGPSTPNQTMVRRKSKKVSIMIRRTGSRSPRERPAAPSPPSLLSPKASQMPQRGSSSRSRASPNSPRRAFEGRRPLNEDDLTFQESSESDITPLSAQKRPLHSATSHRKIPVTRSPDEPAPFSPRATIPSITVSPPNQPISLPQDSPGQVRFSGVHQSRQTVRTRSSADGSLRRHVSFRRRPPAQGSRDPPASSGAPDDVDNGELGDVDTDDDDSEPAPDLSILAARIRHRMNNHSASASGSASASKRASQPLEEGWEPYGYWEDGSFYEWRDIDWLGRPRRRDQSVSPGSSGKDNDKGRASGGNSVSRVWRQLTAKGKKRKTKGKEKEKEKKRVPKWRNHEDYEMELQRYRERREQEARDGIRFEGSEAQRDRLSTVGIRHASSSNDGDNEGDVNLGTSIPSHSFPSQPGDKKKKKKKLGPRILDFFTRLCRKK